MLHGCGWLVHGRGDPQEDPLSPGDPAGGGGRSAAHRVAAAGGQGSPPAFPIAARQTARVSPGASPTQTHTLSGTHVRVLISQQPHGLIVCKQSGLMRRVKVNTLLPTSVFLVADTAVNEAGGSDGWRSPSGHHMLRSMHSHSIFVKEVAAVSGMEPG